MIQVEGLPQLLKIMQDKKHSLGQKFFRAISWMGSQTALYEREVFHKGQPGWDTGRIRQSIGSQVNNKSAVRTEVLIGPGLNKAFALNVNRMKAAHVLNWGYGKQYGFPRFVGFRNNPEFQAWAQRKGIGIPRNKSGEITGGLLIGGKNCKLVNGLMFKQKAEGRLSPLLAEAKKMFYSELKA